MNSIEISDMKVPCFIGIYDFEQENLQDIFITIKLDVDFNKVFQTKDLQHSINYALVEEEVYKFCTQKRHLLIENLLDELLNLCLCFDNCLKACITIKKPQAVKYSSFVSIEGARSK